MPMRASIVAILLLVASLAAADPESWMTRADNTRELAIQLVHGKQCPGTESEALETAKAVFSRYKIEPVSYDPSGDSFGVALRTFCGPSAGGVFLFKVDLFWTRRDEESGELMLYNKFYDRLGAGTAGDLNAAIRGEVGQALEDYLKANSDSANR